MPQDPVLWDHLTTDELAALRDRGCDLCVLPVGATEQHGPHLPLAVDTASAVAVCHAASARTGVPVLPALPYGCSLGHSPRWPGTISLRPATLMAILQEIAEWVHAAGFRRLLVVNGHVTNWAPLRCGLEEVRHRFPDLRIGLRSLWDLGEDIHRRYHQDAASFHANQAETALLLHLDPGAVRRERMVDEPERACGCVFAWRIDQESASGVVGRPSRATAEEGAALFELLAAALADHLRRAAVEEPPVTRPLPE